MVQQQQQHLQRPAGAAEEVSRMGDPSIAAIASKMAGEIYGLKIIKDNIERDIKELLNN